MTAGLLTSAVTVPVFGRIADLRAGRGVLWIGGAAASSFVAAVLAAFTANGGPPRRG